MNQRCFILSWVVWIELYDHGDGLQSVHGNTAMAPKYISAFLTVEFGSEAETVIALILLVPVAIVTNASGCVFAATLVSGMRDRVLD